MTIDIKKLSKIINLNGKELYFGELKRFYSVDTLLYCLDLFGVKNSAVIIRYQDSFYAVLFENLMKEVIIGLDRVWFKKDGYFLVKERSNFIMPYEISRRMKRQFFPGLVNEMLKRDPNMTSYAFRYGNLEEDKTYITESNNYPTLLGFVFKDDFYLKNQLYHLRRYFQGYLYLKRLMEEHNLTAVNPFKSLAIKDNRVVSYA